MSLEALDDVDWQAVQAAFGSAKDVPGLLRALAAPGLGAQAAEELVTRLSVELSIEDTWLVEASALALPFMLELGAQPEVTARAAVLELALQLARAAQAIRALAEVPEEQAEQQTFADALTLALAEHEAQLTQLMADQDPQVRAHAALLLSPAHPADSAPRSIVRAISAALAWEQDPLAKVACIAALEQLGAREVARPSLDDPSFAVRLAAALSLVQVDDAGPRTLAVLSEALADPAQTRESYGEASRFRPLTLARSICSAGALRASALLPGLLQLLLESSPYAADATLEPLLECFFAEGVASPPSYEQAAVLHALARHGQYFRGVANPQAILAARNLPITRAELDELAELGPDAARELVESLA